MTMAEARITTSSAAGKAFEPTHWTMVLAAADTQTPSAPQALEALCRKYRPPIYAFLRAQGNSHEDAEDLAQGFLAYLIANRSLRNMHPAKGKFRSFLL